MNKKIILILALFCLLLCGCGSASDSQTDASSSANSSEEPPLLEPKVYIPSADGKKRLGFSPFFLDVSNLEYGYLIAEADATGSRYNLQLTDPGDITYSYFISSGESAVIPLTGGNGTYVLTAYEQVADSQYCALYIETLDVTLSNIFYPFLYPNQYVNFTPESETSKLAISMLPEDASDLEILDAVYNYVTTHITYDQKKAQTVEAGYLPSVDETLQTGTGICFDYAALMTAMLRTRGVPCKLQIGYSGTIKHAWIDVYIRSMGWINQAISFNGENWSRMDPTFAAGSDDSAAILDYIGDGANYIVQFSR